MDPWLSLCTIDMEHVVVEGLSPINGMPYTVLKPREYNLLYAVRENTKTLIISVEPNPLPLLSSSPLATRPLCVSTTQQQSYFEIPIRFVRHSVQNWSLQITRSRCPLIVLDFFGTKQTNHVIVHNDVLWTHLIHIFSSPIFQFKASYQNNGFFYCLPSQLYIRKHIQEIIQPKQ